MSMGGADKFNLDLLTGLVEKKWEITIITTEASENKWLDVFLKITPDIFVLSNYSGTENYFSCIEYLILSRNPQCILFSNSETGYYLAPLIKYAFPTNSFG